MYLVHQKQAAGALVLIPLFLHWLFFLELYELPNIVRIFSGLVSPTKLKLGTLTDNGLMIPVYRY